MLSSDQVSNFTSHALMYPGVLLFILLFLAYIAQLKHQNIS